MVLKKKEVDTFKKRLLEMHKQLSLIVQGSATEIKTVSEETSGYSQHQADQGTDDFDRTINLEITGNECEILRSVERALEKIEENTYGICDVTGKPIPKARLEAVPYATMTVEAQEKLEKGLI